MKNIRSGAAQAAEEERIWRESSEQNTSGLKGPLCFRAIDVGVKTPTYRAD